MATPPRPPFPIYVLNHIVSMADLTDTLEPGQGWWEIPCASRRAYGCGDNIQDAVEGLVLYARLGDAPHLNSILAIRMTEGARRRFESELDPDYFCRRRDADNKLPSDLIARARVVMAEEHGVTVIHLSFTLPASFFQRTYLCYYLVYDSVVRSLSMFQIRPSPCEGIYEGLYTLWPIVPKRTDGSDCKLLLLGHEESSCEDVLWVGSLSSSDGTGGVMSKLKSMDFPQGLIHKPFNVDVAFSCRGKAFWGDLKQGLLYCDLQTSDLGFVKLPCEYKVDEQSRDESDPLPVRNTRTVGCVGDSIWFVCIDMPSHYTNAVVCIWELQLPLQPGGQLEGKRMEVQWKEVEKVPAKVLWALPSFKESGLPPAPFQYPILTKDGALCFVLIDQSMFPRNERPLLAHHLCIFDMRYKRLLWHGLVHNYQISDTVIMQPSSNFLRMKQCSQERSFVETVNSE